MVRLLNDEAVDLVEISGGSYESPAMHGRPASASTRAREAYFVDFARDIVAEAQMPVMVTGGIRRRGTAVDALSPEDGRDGVDMIGIGQALAYAPDLPDQWRKAETVVTVPAVRWQKRALASLATMAMTKAQLRRMGQRRSPKPISAIRAVIVQQFLNRWRNRQYRAWLNKRSKSERAEI